MKTAISVPDDTFERASKQAGALGMSRSEFFARAAERYLDELDSESLTKQIDDAIDRVGQLPDQSVLDAVAIGQHVLGEVAADGW